MSTTTERLYYDDSHLTEFEARVVGVEDMEDGRTGVRLDRTAFYPTGGGQPSDTGALGRMRVVECIDEEEVGVVHVVEGARPQVGETLKGRVDWSRRQDHLQQHTGQHILSQAFVELFHAETRSFRMLERVSEIDVALPDPSDERIERAVELANRIIWEDRPVRLHRATAEEAARMPLRKDSSREGELRIIEIEGFDMSPCGGTHAARTGEVGLVAVRSWERAKGLTRVEFVAGRRALEDYRRANTTAREVASLFSVGRDEAVAAVSRLVEENKQLARRLRVLEELEARVEADELLSSADETLSATETHAAVTTPAITNAARDRVRIVARTFAGRDADALKRLASALVARPATIALLGSFDADTARLVFARSSDARGDMGVLMREACAQIEGRGGGRSELAQGGGRRVDKLAESIAGAARRLSES